MFNNENAEVYVPLQGETQQQKQQQFPLTVSHICAGTPVPLTHKLVLIVIATRKHILDDGLIRIPSEFKLHSWITSWQQKNWTEK